MCVITCIRSYPSKSSPTAQASRASDLGLEALFRDLLFFLKKGPVNERWSCFICGQRLMSNLPGRNCREVMLAATESICSTTVYISVVQVFCCTHTYMSTCSVSCLCAHIYTSEWSSAVVPKVGVTGSLSGEAAGIFRGALGGKGEGRRRESYLMSVYV